MQCSIITINYNNNKGLNNTIESVINQTYTEFEFIIIDGGSDDGSVQTIKKFEKRLRYWISEKDDGIYNAMNKGVKVSKGNYCLFLNSGDYLIDNYVLDDIFNKHKPQTDIFSGIAKMNKHLWYPIEENKISLSFFYFSGFCHQATFIKRELFDLNLYDENMKIVGDSKFFIQTIINENSTYKAVHRLICYYDEPGVSSDNEKRINELKGVFVDLFKPRILIDLELLKEHNNSLSRMALKIMKIKFFKFVFKLVGIFVHRLKDLYNQ